MLRVPGQSIQVLDKGYVSVVEVMGTDESVVEAAHESGYKTTLSSPASLIDKLLASRPPHTSPFEQAVMKFRVKCPIMVARHWMRHRTWSYSELSRRYSIDEVDFYLPTEWRDMEGNVIPCDCAASLKMFSDMGVSLYKQAMAVGVAREMARMFLPLNAYTVFIGSVDLNNLMKFLEQRLGAYTQMETRAYAMAVYDLFARHFPLCAAAFVKHRASPSLNTEGT